MSNTELKPCPFCGADDPEIVEEIDHMLKQIYTFVRCPCCGASSGGHFRKDVAIKRWNRRANDG